MHHPQHEVNPLSVGKISAILGVSKSIWGDIYKYAVKNVAGKQLVQTDGGGNTEFVAERELERSGSEIQIPESIELDEYDIPLLEWISAQCLDFDACIG